MANELEREAAKAKKRSMTSAPLRGSFLTGIFPNTYMGAGSIIDQSSIEYSGGHRFALTLSTPSFRNFRAGLYADKGRLKGL